MIKKLFGIDCRPYHDIDVLIKKERLNIVSICTPPETHFYLSKKVLENKVNVFCEKPFTEKVSEAEELFKIAKKNAVKISVNTQWPAVLEEIKYEKNISKFEMYTEPGVKGKDMLKDHLPHTNSMLIKLGGLGKMSDLSFKRKDEKDIELEFNYIGKRKISVRYIFRYNPNHPRKVSFKINNTKFVRKVSPDYSQILLTDGKEIKITDPLSISIKKFISSIKNGRLSLMSESEIICNLKMQGKIISKY